MGLFSRRQPERANLSLVINSPQSYSSILNRLEMIVSEAAENCYCDVGVVVQVRKIDDTYCSVGCSLLADSSFRNVTFGDGFKYNGEDHAMFETKLATGFTTPNDVIRELKLQFNWPDLGLVISKENMKVLDYGDYTNTPYICYEFTISH